MANGGRRKCNLILPKIRQSANKLSGMKRAECQWFVNAAGTKDLPMES